MLVLKYPGQSGQGFGIQLFHWPSEGTPDWEPREEYPSNGEKVSSTVDVAQFGKPDGEACGFTEYSQQYSQKGLFSAHGR